MIASAVDCLTRASLRLKWITLGLALLALVAGVLALTQLKQELIPSIDFPANIVLALHPGAGAESMRDEVTIPIENAVQGIEGVVSVQSTTSDGVALVVIMNEYGLDQEALRAEVRSATEGLPYPAGMEMPELLTFGMDDLPLVYASVSADRPLAELKALVESNIVPALEEVPGIADVQVSGGQELPAESAAGGAPAAQPTPPAATPPGGTSPLPDMWQAAGKSRGISLSVAGDVTPQVIQAISSMAPQMLALLTPENLRDFSPEVLAWLPAAYVETLDSALRAELDQLARPAGGLGALASGGAPAFAPETTVATVNGNPALLLMIYKDGEANTVSTSHALYDEMASLEAAYPGLAFERTFEQAPFIEESIRGVTREGLLGALFAVVVILVFLSGTVRGRYRPAWRSTLVTGVSIPLSVFMAFALLKWLPPVTDLALEPLAGATEGIPVLGTLVTLIHRLFPAGFTLNVLTLSGMTVAVGRVVDDSIVVLENIYRHIQRGEDRRQAVLVGVRDVSIAILASTVTTVIVFLPIGLVGGMVGQFFLPFGVTVAYALGCSFFVAVTVVPLLAYLFIRKENLPEPKETALQRTYTPALQWALKHRALVLAIAGALFAGSLFLLGRQPRALMPDMGEPRISVSVDLPDGTAMSETAAAVAEFEKALTGVAGLGTVQSEVGSGGGMMGMARRMLGMGGGIDQTVANSAIAVQDGGQIDALTVTVRQLAEQVFGAENVAVSGGSFMSSSSSGFSLVLSGEPERLAEVDDEVLAALEGVEGLANVTSNLAEGNVILRVDGRPAVEYTGEVETADAMGLARAAQASVEAILPAGISASEGFQSQQQTRGFREAVQAMLISIVAVYAVMIVTFRSFVHPFTILFSLPLALIGAAAALWLTGGVVGLSVLVGLMMLVGIVVTNAIVLIDRVQTNRKLRGMDAREALVEGGRTRLRPILMTAIATILALMPLGIGFTEGAFVASELARVVIGGLLTSTLLTLVIVPVVYSLLDRLTAGRRNRAKPESP